MDNFDIGFGLCVGKMNIIYIKSYKLSDFKTTILPLFKMKSIHIETKPALTKLMGEILKEKLDVDSNKFGFIILYSGSSLSFTLTEIIKYKFLSKLVEVKFDYGTVYIKGYDKTINYLTYKRKYYSSETVKTIIDSNYRKYKLLKIKNNL
jgi:hypothetical protein